MRNPNWKRRARASFGCESQRIGRGRVLGAFLLLLPLLASSCAVPGRLYRIAPEIRGTIVGTPGPDAALRLSVQNRDVPTLFDLSSRPLAQDAHFRFEPRQHAIAGREYGKIYRVFLRYESGETSRVLWRGEFSRRAISVPIELDCDLARPPRLGQPCRVREPLRHAWLITNGERAFDRLCQRCHRPEPLGPVASAGPIDPRPPRLEAIAARHPDGFDRDRVAEWIEGTQIPREHGTRSMPVWGERLSAVYSAYPNTDELVGATLDPIVVYLMSIQED